MKKITSIVVVLFTMITTFAIDTARIRITKLDKSVSEQNVKLQKMSDGAWRFRVPVAKISRDTDTIEVVNDWAKALKGEENIDINIPIK